MERVFEAGARKCKNCGTARFPIRARGLCGRCYPRARRIEELESCDGNIQIRLPGHPRGLPHNPARQEAEQMRRDVIEQLKAHLKNLRRDEDRLRGPISSLDIEYELQWLAESAGAKDARRIMHGTAACVDNFTPKQKAILFKLLFSIEEAVPRRFPIRWTRYMNLRDARISRKS